MAPCPRDQLNAKAADVMSLPGAGEMCRNSTFFRCTVKVLVHTSNPFSAASGGYLLTTSTGSLILLRVAGSN